MYQVTKTLGPFPCSHRNHRHDGDCKFVHGYNITVKITVETEKLDKFGFVVDFGKFKTLRQMLHDWFDHRLVIGFDDPQLPALRMLERMGGVKLHTMDHVSMEHRAEVIFKACRSIHKLPVTRVEVLENDKNSGAYYES